MKIKPLSNIMRFDAQNNVVGYSRTKELYIGESYGKR